MMPGSNLISRLLLSKVFRLSLEVLVSLFLFSWLPMPAQIVATIVVSLGIEAVSGRIMKSSLQKELATKNWSEILGSYDIKREL